MALTYTTSSVIINDHTWKVRHFSDRDQFPSELEKLQIGELLWGQDVPSALWPLVGIIWPAGLIMADLVSRMSLKQLRVLELGCGLAISSMIAHKSGNPVIATDYNPFASELLKANAVLNELNPIAFIQMSWHDEYVQDPFDLILGSDVLYEPNCVFLMVQFLRRALVIGGRALFVDPGRDHVRKFELELIKNGFDCEVIKPNFKQKMRVLNIVKLH